MPKRETKRKIQNLKRLPDEEPSAPDTRGVRFSESVEDYLFDIFPDLSTEFAIRNNGMSISFNALIGAFTSIALSNGFGYSRPAQYSNLLVDFLLDLKKEGFFVNRTPNHMRSHQQRGNGTTGKVVALFGSNLL